MTLFVFGTRKFGGNFARVFPLDASESGKNLEIWEIAWSDAAPKSTKVFYLLLQKNVKLYNAVFSRNVW